MSNEELKRIATQVRRDVLRMVYNANSGHIGGSFSCADILTLLYFRFMNHSPDFYTMEGEGQDMFVLSNGHISPAFYSILARNDYFSLDELKTFRKIDSRLQGHPATAEGLPGVRVATGSLGQGLSVALGMALGKKQKEDEGIVYSLHGDGEMQEGQNWEAFMFGGNHKIDNIISIIDYNNKQIDGDVDNIMDIGDPINLYNKLEKFGWKPMIMNGHNYKNMTKILNNAKNNLGHGKPICIIMKTHMGYNINFMMDDHNWHGKPPTKKELNEALKQLPETLRDF